MDNVRKLVFASLRSCNDGKKYTNLEADSTVKKQKLTGRDKGFYVALLYGVTERGITLEYIAEKLCGRPFGKLQINVQILLKIGLYQLIYMDSVPDYAAVGETVRLARTLVNRGAVSMINAVLRECSRRVEGHEKRDEVFFSKSFASVASRLSVLYSVREHICAELLNDYGESTAEKILDSFFAKQYLSLKVNTLKTDMDSFSGDLRTAGYKAEKSAICDNGIVISDPGSVTDIPGYRDGLFYVQDDSSYEAVKALMPGAGDCLLDACACPGGKSFAAAILMKNKGSILSCDLHDSKISLIESGAERLGIGIIKTECIDATVFNSHLEEKFDKVICDVPCSGVGIIGKKPDLRYKNREETEKLPSLQNSILANCSRYLKKGGKLLYSTCTLFKSENEFTVRNFLCEHKECRLLTQKTFLPFEGNTDGFYLAVIGKDI